jgi:Flp pilus assembly protein TadB
MISDAERRRLDEIERLMRLEDPVFVQRFYGRTHTRRGARSVARTAILASLAIVVAPAVSAVAAALGGPVAAVMAVFVMTTVCVGVVFWRRRAERPKRCG